MKSLSIALLALTTVFSTTSQADTLGLFIGGGGWNHEPSGGFQSVAPVSTDIALDTDLGMKKETEGYAYIALEHPIPLIPNIRLEQTALTHNGTATGLTFNGVAALNGPATVSLDSTDMILYWRLLDNWVNLDVGITLRQFDGEFTLATESLTIKETIPMVYAAAQFDLPFSGLSVGGDINVINLDNNSLTDTRIRVLYEMGLIGFEAGLRTTTIELTDVDNITTAIDFDGLFVGAFLHF